jgi:hypothetical protein
MALGSNQPLTEMSNRIISVGKSRPARLIRGWVGLRAGLDAAEKRKFLTLPGLELRPSIVQLVAPRYTDCAIPARTVTKF